MDLAGAFLSTAEAGFGATGLARGETVEEMAGLARGHRDQPTGKRSTDWVGKQHHISAEKADRADKMQRLVDPAVMVITMVIPALQFECFEK